MNPKMTAKKLLLKAFSFDYTDALASFCRMSKRKLLLMTTKCHLHAELELTNVTKIVFHDFQHTMKLLEAVL